MEGKSREEIAGASLSAQRCALIFRNRRFSPARIYCLR